MLFKSGRQLTKPPNFWKITCGNKNSRQHPLTHSLDWARISSVSMSWCLPGNWSKQSLFNSPQICIPYFPLFLFSGSIKELTNFALCVHIHAFIYVHTYVCVYLFQLNNFFKKKKWGELECRKPSFGLCMSSRTNYYTLLQHVRLGDYFWKISCMCTSWTLEVLVSYKQREKVNSKIIKHSCCLINNCLILSSSLQLVA